MLNTYEKDDGKHSNSVPEWAKTIFNPLLHQHYLDTLAAYERDRLKLKKRIEEGGSSEQVFEELAIFIRRRNDLTTKLETISNNWKSLCGSGD